MVSSVKSAMAFVEGPYN